MSSNKKQDRTPKTESERKRLARSMETPEDAALRLQKQRAYQASLRANETDEDPTQRVEKQRAYQASLRVDETEEEATQRRELANSLKSLHRSNLTNWASCPVQASDGYQCCK